MKKGLLLMTALLFISGASMAQKVVNIGGKAIIDNRYMPDEAITMEKKERTTDATNDKLGAKGLTNLASAESNKTVSYYFEVMKTDYNNGTLMNWLAAIEGCAQYNSGDGDNTWRLPTQRELQLIWTLHKTLIKKAELTTFVTDTYWSATESIANKGWYVSFYNGTTGFGTAANISKENKFRVRCIRDLTPP